MRPNQPQDGNRGGGRYRGGRRNDSGNRGNGSRDGYRRDNRDNRGSRGDRGEGRREGRFEHRRDDVHRAGGENRESHEGRGWVEVSGRTVEEAREEAARRFNVGDDQMRIEVLDEGSRGFLGLGAKPARLKVSLKGPAAAAYAEAVLSRVLRAMGLPDKVKRKKDADGNNVLDVEGPSGGLLIGRHGQTLESLQYIVSKIVQKACDDERSLVIIDIESYRERQREKLHETALSMAKKAAETGQTVPLQPMSSRDRRVVHLALRDHADVTTQSQGEGPRRRVMIVPKQPAPPQEASAPAQAPAPEGTPGNEAPGSFAVEHPAGDPEAAGNAAPPPAPDVDDNIGNRV